MTDETVVPLFPAKPALKIVESTEDPTPDDILDAARGRLEQVLVIGWTTDDEKLWCGTSPMTYAEILELLEGAKDVFKHARDGGDD